MAKALLSLLVVLSLYSRVSAVPASTLHFERPLVRPDTVAEDTHTSSQLGSWHILSDWAHRLFSSPSSHEQHASRIISSPSPAPSTIPKGLFASYQDQVVVRFIITSNEEIIALRDASNTLFLDIWDASAAHVDLRLARHVLPSLLGLLPRSMQQPQKMLFQGSDLLSAMSETYSSAANSKDLQFDSRFQPAKAMLPVSGPQLNPAQSSVFFREYRPLSVLQPWMRLLQSLFSTHVRLVTVGRSWEGRDITAVRVGVHPTNNDRPLGPRKTIVVTGGSHAREWISTSTVAYVMYSLVSAYGRFEAVTRMLEEVDFLFVPTMNPDGYVYSWEVDRLWRKTRQPTPIRFCRGIDMDRTWGFEWGHAKEHASSANPCSESYEGDKPFESVEAASFARWVRNETLSGAASFIGMLDLHSYSQSILLPYSFSCTTEPPALEDLEELGEGMSREIRRTFGEYYDVLSACEGLSMTNKTSDAKTQEEAPRLTSARGNPLDWFYHEMGIRYSFQIKLRDMGSYGFLLPPDYIIPQGEEMYNAVTYLAQSLLTTDARRAEQKAKSGKQHGNQKPLAT